MKAIRTPEQVLAEIAAISEMEIGSISVYRRPAGYKIFTHNIYEKCEGENKSKTRTRNVPVEDLDSLQELIAAHNRFRSLVKEYERLIVERTRQARKDRHIEPPG